MVENAAFENGRISNFEGIITVTLDRVILHTVVYHSLTSIYMPNFIEIIGTFCGRADIHTKVRTYERVDGRTFETHLIRLTQKSRSKN